MNKYSSITGILAAIALLFSATAYGQQTPPAPPEGNDIPEGGNPEYRVKSLPNDTFKPSEKISEDFPVPFPVDI